MKVRAIVLVVSLLPLGAVTAAHAAKRPAPKPVCNLLTDPQGDAGIDPVPGDANDDIVSADVASDGKKITAVLRMAAMAQPDPAVLGRSLGLEFSARGSENTLFLAARTYPTGTKYLFGYTALDESTGVNTRYTIGEATGSVDPAKKEVRITAANAAFAPSGTKLPKGIKLSALTASADRIFGQGVVPSQEVGGERVPLGGLTLQFDEATGKSYVVGTPSCVKPGS
ncbi:MAG TPA: hypothetical protein VM097_00780 [Mycobacteriales bacterium]|nr:hypothetical protein [Mycobacteriales bacterium]